jgi:hypothetical protein
MTIYYTIIDIRSIILLVVLLLLCLLNGELQRSVGLPDLNRELPDRMPERMSE